MPLDPNNPSAPVDTSLEEWRTKTAQSMEQMAENLQNITVPATQLPPLTEGRIYLSMLESVLIGKLVTNSNDAQVWATDLTRDYLTKYNLDGTPK